jgi:hypothetical protein
MTFRHDMDWQRALIPEVKRIIANYLIDEAPDHEDMHRNTDLIVLGVASKRIACRMRRHQYLAEYGHEFTIRAGRPSGELTELAKVITGWGDYIFYGFATEDQTAFAYWLLGDLSVFRLWFMRELSCGRRPWVEQQNTDGSSSFMAFRIADLPEEFVVSRSKLLRAVAAS